MIDNIIRISDLAMFTKNHQIDREKFTGYIFHGTREFFVDCDETTLTEVHDHCGKVLSHLYEKIKTLSPDLINGYYSKTGNSIFSSSVFHMFGKSSKYEYKDFYGTLNYLAAIDFSNNDCGELCTHAYYAGLAIEDLGLIDDAIKKSIDYINSFRDKAMKSNRIILAIPNVLYSDLEYESGRPLVDLSETKENIEEDIDWAIEQMYEEQVTNNVQTNNNYRIKNISKYKKYLIPRNLFKDGISVFTDITMDIDKYINSRYINIIF